MTSRSTTTRSSRPSRSEGKWVYLEDEDFKGAALDQAQKTIDIRAFVEQEEIDPIFFERTYYLAPKDGGEKVYTLLARAMEQSGLVAVATFVMRDRQHLGCLRIRDGVITLERMHFADEIRPAKGIAPKGVRVDKKELEMASQLVKQFSGAFKPGVLRHLPRHARQDHQGEGEGRDRAGRGGRAARGSRRSHGRAARRRGRGEEEPRQGAQAAEGEAQGRVTTGPLSR